MPSPGVTLPGPFVTAPSPVPPVASCWLRTSARDAEFEQGVLYGCGPAQVGFGVQLSSFHRLTLSSGGRLSPEPLRLTRPPGAKACGAANVPAPSISPLAQHANSDGAARPAPRIFALRFKPARRRTRETCPRMTLRRSSSPPKTPVAKPANPVEAP